MPLGVSANVSTVAQRGVMSIQMIIRLHCEPAETRYILPRGGSLFGHNITEVKGVEPVL